MVAVAKQNRKMRVTKRIVNTKRHTKGYVIDGRDLPTKVALELAEEGRLNGIVRVGNHLQAAPGSRRRRLLDLPVRIDR